LVPASPRLIQAALLNMDSFGLVPQDFSTEIIGEPGIGVRGAYLHFQASRGSASRRVIFWSFGGAFVGGTVKGNLGIAAAFGQKLGCDVFVPHLRLWTEKTVPDQVEDAVRAYAWLLSRVAANCVVAMGYSSGAGTVLRVLQVLRDSGPKLRSLISGVPNHNEVLSLPVGAVLMGAFVDYRPEVREEMGPNAVFDLIVSPRVLDSVADIMDGLCGGRSERIPCTPLLHQMEGLCPLLLTSSEHEACWLQDYALYERAKAANLDVELYTRPFLPHVYPLLSCFLPEASEAQDHIVSWVRARGAQWL